MDDVELQQRLTRLAERTAPPPRESLAGVVVARHRAQRRQAIGMTGLVAAVAALVVISTTTFGGSSTEPAGATAVGAAGPESAVAAAVDVLGGPTRGSLAGDATFLTAVRALSWQNPVGGPYDPDADVAPETRRLLFAGDVGGSRLALVAGVDPAPPVEGPVRPADEEVLSDVALAWFVGPAGATPDDLRLQAPSSSVDAYAGAAALVVQDTGAVVVVGQPGDAISISLRPEVAADGSVGRAFEPVEATDGVATLVLPSGSDPGQALRYRVVRGAQTWTSGLETTGSTTSRPEVAITRLRPAPPPVPGDGMIDMEIDRVLGQLGLPAGELDFAVPWAGDVPGPHDRPARVTVLTATLPSGAVYVTVPYGYARDDSGGYGGSGCGSQLLPAGPPIEQRTIAVRCDVLDGSFEAVTVSSLVVVGPATATTIRLVDGNDAEIVRHPVTDGVAVVPAPEALGSIETLAADGSSLGRTKPMGFADLGE